MLIKSILLPKIIAYIPIIVNFIVNFKTVILRSELKSALQTLLNLESLFPRNRLDYILAEIGKRQLAYLN